MLPKARDEKLVVQEVGDELVVYDLARHRAHRLNPTTALVWRHCDGRTSLAAMAALLNSEFHLPADGRIVWSALDQLVKARLLKEGPVRPPEAAPISRRQAVALGMLGAVSLLLPGCDSVTAPAPESALAGMANPDPAECSKFGCHIVHLPVRHCGPTGFKGKAGCPEGAPGSLGGVCQCVEVRDKVGKVIDCRCLAVHTPAPTADCMGDCPNPVIVRIERDETVKCIGGEVGGVPNPCAATPAAVALGIQCECKGRFVNEGTGVACFCQAK